MPEATLEAVADHAIIREDTLHGTYDQPQQVLEKLARLLGNFYNNVVARLETEGVEKFTASWSELSDELNQVLSAQTGCGNN